MKNREPRRLDIFLRLALRRAEHSDAADGGEIDILTLEKKSDSGEAEPFVIEDFPVLLEQLNKNEIQEVKSLLEKYQESDNVEIKEIENFIGKDDTTLDEIIHWSHIEEVLRKESIVVQTVVGEFLLPTHKQQLEPYFKSVKILPEKKALNGIKYESEAVKKSVHRGFIKNFVCLSNLENSTDFDRLDGSQTVRLIRLAGISEVAYACVRIEAVESVAAFLKRFSTEDARAIATQLSNLPKTSAERLTFAENLVQQMMELEQQPTALLDMLGLQILGIHLCRSPKNRIDYTKQKMPIEFSPELDELISKRCEQTPETIQKEISRETDKLAESIIKTDKGKDKNKTV